MKKVNEIKSFSGEKLLVKFIDKADEKHENFWDNYCKMMSLEIIFD